MPSWCQARSPETNYREVSTIDLSSCSRRIERPVLGTSVRSEVERIRLDGIYRFSRLERPKIGRTETERMRVLRIEPPSWCSRRASKGCRSTVEIFILHRVGRFSTSAHIYIAHDAKRQHRIFSHVIIVNNHLDAEVKTCSRPYALWQFQLYTHTSMTHHTTITQNHFHIIRTYFELISIHSYQMNTYGLMS